MAVRFRLTCRIDPVIRYEDLGRLIGGYVKNSPLTHRNAGMSGLLFSMLLWLVHPEVVELSQGSGRIIAIPAEEPEISAAIDPIRSSVAGSRKVHGGRYARSTVHSGLVIVV